MTHVQIVSLWRNDATRDINTRVGHLLSKQYHADAGSGEVIYVSYLWGVGDSTDDTYDILSSTADECNNINVVDVSTGLRGMALSQRRLRMALSATHLFAHIDIDADYVLMHESDLLSPPTIVRDFLHHAARGIAPIAGWPIINLTHPQFYDVYAYRHLNGRHFTADETRLLPAMSPFEVASFGSVWMAPAHLVRGYEMNDECVVDLCRQWQRDGRSLYCDPAITITQPTHLWADLWAATVDGGTCDTCEWFT